MLTNKKSYLKARFYDLSHKCFYSIQLDVISDNVVGTRRTLCASITQFMNEHTESIAYLTIESVTYNVDGTLKTRTTDYYYEW